MLAHKTYPAKILNPSLYLFAYPEQVFVFCNLVRTVKTHLGSSKHLLFENWLKAFLQIIPSKMPLHKKMNFSLRVSSVNVTKSALVTITEEILN